MLKLTTFPTLIFATALLSGCVKAPEIPVDTSPRFCDVEEQRRFSQDEIDWRAENAPWNLRKDLKTNETGKRECGWGG